MKNKYYSFILFIVIGLLFQSCKEDKPLPLLGKKQNVGEDIYHTIPDFSLINQDSLLIDNNTLKDNIYIADFFFTSCPSICPKVAQQMLRIQEAYPDEEMFKILSYTIDPKRDTPSRLENYAKKIGANTEQWHFLTGDQDVLFELADGYWISAFKDKDAPGGFDHSGKIILVDKDRHIRSFCDGTEPESVTRFIKDIAKLLKEYQTK